VVGLFVGANLRLLCRPLPIVPHSAPWIVGFAIAGLIAFLATPLWISLLRFVGATPAGVSDPVFSKDLSFYLLALPLYDDIVEIVIAILCLTIALWLAIGLTTRRGASALFRRPGESGVIRTSRGVVVLLPGSLAADALWLRQGMVLGALLCAALAVSQFLARYHLVADGHSKVVAGASYADVSFWIPGYNLVVICWLAAALILMLAAFVPQFRAWLLIHRSHWLTPFAGLAILALAAFVVPAAIEDVYVGPNQITLELPYLVRSIAGTRTAYNLEGPSVEEREFAVSRKPLTVADLDKDAATLQDARIWDWRALEP
jgi:uncharacterized membrane protein (UPF0182 family)